MWTQQTAMEVTAVRIAKFNARQREARKRVREDDDDAETALSSKCPTPRGNHLSLNARLALAAKHAVVEAVNAGGASASHGGDTFARNAVSWEDVTGPCAMVINAFRSAVHKTARMLKKRALMGACATNERLQATFEVYVNEMRASANVRVVLRMDMTRCDFYVTMRGRTVASWVQMLRHLPHLLGVEQTALAI